MLALLLTGASSVAQARESDPLQAVTRCIDSGEFHSPQKDRLPEGKTQRQVNTATGPMDVSLADGYRMMMFRQSREPFVNLKIERSAVGKFADDRNAIMQQLAKLSAGANPPGSVPPETATRQGIEIASLNNPAIGTAGVISFYTLFGGASGTIATAYILNQAPKTRDYADQAGYNALRDRFIDALTACMARPAQ
jgi:hypothetical protein